MQYRVLTVEDQMNLLSERIGELEREHFRSTLRAMELEGVDLAAHGREVQIAAAIEARIVRHIGEPEPEHEPEQTVDLVKRTTGPAADIPAEPSAPPASLDPASGDGGD